MAFLRAAVEGRIDDSRESLTRLGILTADSDLTNDELQQWFSYTNYPMTSPQPVTFTPDAVARIVGGFFDARDRHHPVAKINVPAEHVFTSRIVLAFNSVAAGLQATLPIRAIFDDLDGVTEPITELGKLHHAWVRERGLPGALDHHDHP